MAENNKKTTYSLGIVLLGVLMGLLVGLMFGPKLRPNRIVQVQGNRASLLVSQILDLVDRAYVDKVDYDSVSERMINAMLSSLDPTAAICRPKRQSRTMR